jgi:hypothetical protein
VSNWKKGRKTITIKCDYCKKDFDKIKIEYERASKRGYNHHYCSRTCAGKVSVKNIPKEKKTWGHLLGRNNSDDYTDFRYYLRTASRRLKDCDITLEDLKTVWCEQNGICPYSGIKLQLSRYTKVVKNPIYSASLDRIDSSKGYVKGNIQFVSRPINYMKNNMSHEQTIELIEILKHNSL